MIGMEFHQPLRMILLQETGWQLNSQWEANGWYIIHSSGHRISILCMIHCCLLRPDQLTWAEDTTVAIPWRLDLNLRGPEAVEFHSLLLKLAGNGITQFILMRMR